MFGTVKLSRTHVKNLFNFAEFGNLSNNSDTCSTISSRSFPICCSLSTFDLFLFPHTNLQSCHTPGRWTHRCLCSSREKENPVPEQRVMIMRFRTPSHGNNRGKGNATGAISSKSDGSSCFRTRRIGTHQAPIAPKLSVKVNHCRLHGRE